MGAALLGDGRLCPAAGVHDRRWVRLSCGSLGGLSSPSPLCPVAVHPQRPSPAFAWLSEGRLDSIGFDEGALRLTAAGGLACGRPTRDTAGLHARTPMSNRPAPARRPPAADLLDLHTRAHGPVPVRHEPSSGTTTMTKPPKRRWTTAVDATEKGPRQKSRTHRRFGAVSRAERGWWHRNGDHEPLGGTRSPTGH